MACEIIEWIWPEPDGITVHADSEVCMAMSQDIPKPPGGMRRIEQY